VPEVRVQGRGLLLRFFGPQSAEEFWVPEELLRVRAPGSGEPLDGPPGAAGLEGCEMRGGYGVALRWADGRRDIFALSALRRIAHEHALTSKT